MKESTYDEIIEKFNQIDGLLFNQKQLAKIFELAIRTDINYKKNNSNGNRRILNEAVQKVLSLDIKYPDYYPFEKGEITSDLILDRDLAELYNARNALINATCKTIIKYAVAVLGDSQDVKNCYEDYLLATRTLSNFKLDDIVIGLSHRASKDTFRKDIWVIKLVTNYLQTGRLSKYNVSFYLEDYRNLWPNSKIEIANTLKELSNVQKQETK